eukprot:m.94840 g.94840  ORF g.94840 m.94840 type:complete len:1016 (-) comp12421_c0_seq1:88-3135(-)
MGTESFGDLWPELQNESSCNFINEYQFEKRLESSQEPQKSKNLHLDEGVQGIERALTILRDIKVNNLNSDFRMVAAMNAIVDEVNKKPKAIKKVYSALKGAFTVCDAFVKESSVPILSKVTKATTPYPCEILLPWYMHSLENAQDAEEQSVWQDGIVKFTATVSHKILIDHVWKLAQAAGWMTEKVDSRTFSCRLLGAIATRCCDGETPLPERFLEAVKAAISDIHPSVRVSACSAVMQCLLLPVLKKSQIQDLLGVVEGIIVEENNALVRNEALTQLISIFPKVDENMKHFFAKPILASYRQLDIKDNPEENIGYCKQIGAVMHFYKSCYDATEMAMLLKVFHEMAMYSEEETPIITANPKYYAAYNFPAVALCTRNIYIQEVREGVSTNQTILAKCFSVFHHTDTHPVLRAMFAKGLHEILEGVGPRFSFSSCALSGVMGLLVDVDLRVLSALTENFDRIIKTMVLPMASTQRDVGSMAGPFKKCKSGFAPTCLLVRSLAAVQRLKDHWRPQRSLLMHLQKCQKFFTSEALHSVMTPSFEDILLHNSVALPVRNAICDAFASLMVATKKFIFRLRLIEWQLVHLLGSEKSSKRIIFVVICSKICLYFSRSFFKEFYFSPVLTLANDPVLNVRRQLCDILPLLKKMLILPKDHGLHRKFENATASLEEGAHDDIDWTEYLKDVNKKLEAIDTPITWDSSFVFEDHHIDQLKEEDEQTIAKQAEESEESSSARKKINTHNSQKEIKKLRQFLSLPPQPGSARRSRSHSPRRGSDDSKHKSPTTDEGGIRKERRRSSLFRANGVLPRVVEQSGEKSPTLYEYNNTRDNKSPSPLAPRKTTRMKTRHDRSVPKFSTPVQQRKEMRHLLSSQSQPNISSSPSTPSPSKKKYSQEHSNLSSASSSNLTSRKRSDPGRSSLHADFKFDKSKERHKLSRPKLSHRSTSQDSIYGRRMRQRSSSTASTSTSRSEPSNGFLGRMSSNKKPEGGTTLNEVRPPPSSLKPKLRKLPQLSRNHLHS